MPSLSILALLGALAQPTPGGLKGLGAPGVGLRRADPKALACEKTLLEAINGARTAANQTVVQPDDGLRTFARRYAELAATGDPGARRAEDAIKAERLAPLGFRWQYSAGADPNAILQELTRGNDGAIFVSGDFGRAGVGAFWVPDTPPYWQVALLFVQDPDPRAGQPGLSPTQTDPVMLAAGDKLRACYDAALRRNPNLGGDVVLRVVIGARGAVESVGFTRTLGDLPLDGCLRDVVRGLIFPAPYKGKPVTLFHPMRLTPPQGGRKLGKLTAQQLSGGFALGSEDFRNCFIERQKLRPKLGGTLTLTGVINTEGTLTKCDVLYDEIGDP
ncbi:MAG TPA: AgmX/PglI C-terminal domain-containing protein, partial [Myxococcota bacterium]|nr:AgmX/PglI C-terminal domain-containing protein [Myxococcota bacterium]